MSPDAWYTRYVSNYIDVLNEPLYPFGYGLSYTTYTYGDVSLNMNSMDANGKITSIRDCYQYRGVRMERKSYSFIYVISYAA